MSFNAEKRNASAGAGHGHKVAGEARQCLIYIRKSCTTLARAANRAGIANDKLGTEV